MILGDYWPIVLGVGAVLYLAASQVRTRNYSPDKLWAIPLLLVVVGIVVAGQHAWTDPSRAPVLIVSIGIGLLTGLLRGWVNRVQRDPRNGLLTVYGSVSDLAIWVATVIVYVVVRSLVSGQFGFDNDTTLPSLLLFFGLTLLFQRLCWNLKATMPTVG